MNRGPLAALVLALAAHAAHAQAPAPNAAADAALAEGRRLYDLQEWDKAIAKFKEAYTLREDAPALFNVAQSYRLKGDCAQAASFYKTFKRKFPKEKNVDKFISEMETCAKTQKAEPPKTEPPKTEPPKTEPPKTEPPKTEPPKTEPPKTEPPKTEPLKTEPVVGPIDNGGGGGTSGLRIASYVTFGAGAVGLGVGIAFGFKARGAANEAEDLAMGDMWKPSIEDRGLRYQRTAMVGLISGAVLVAGAVVMFTLSGPKKAESSAVTFVPTSEGAQFVWAGQF